MTRGRAGTRPVIVTVAVEGILDEAIVHRLLEHLGAGIGAVHGRHGKRHLERSLRGYNEAARLSPWLVMLDLDSDAECAPILRAQLLASESPMMLLRIAVPKWNPGFSPIVSGSHDSLASPSRQFRGSLRLKRIRSAPLSDSRGARNGVTFERTLFRVRTVAGLKGQVTQRA
jgi:hypothetical protein